MGALQVPFCNQSGECFGRNATGECEVLTSTFEGRCPFQKPKREVSAGAAPIVATSESFGTCDWISDKELVSGQSREEIEDALKVFGQEFPSEIAKYSEITVVRKKHFYNFWDEYYAADRSCG